MNMHQTRPAGATPVMSERRVGIIGALIVAIGPVSMSLFTPAMPELVADFGTTESMVKMTLSLYFAGFAVTQLVCGPLSDGYGRKPVTFGFMLIYGAVTMGLTMVLLFTGLDIVTAFSAVVATVNNIGPGLGLVGPASNFGVLSDVQIWVLSFAMLLGRLELLTVLVLFTGAFWRK